MQKYDRLTNFSHFIKTNFSHCIYKESKAASTGKRNFWNKLTKTDQNWHILIAKLSKYVEISRLPQILFYKRFFKNKKGLKLISRSYVKICWWKSSSCNFTKTDQTLSLSKCVYFQSYFIIKCIFWFQFRHLVTSWNLRLES